MDRSLRSRQRLSSERGQELVEFAFASVLLLTLILLILEGGLMIYNYNMLSNMAQAGARWAAVRGAGSSAFTGTTYADLQNYITAMDGTVSVTTTPANTAPSTLTAGDTITVNVSRPFPSTVAFFTMTGSMQASATMVVAR
jgi:Flp pilus assembly protein TadG